MSKANKKGSGKSAEKPQTDKSATPETAAENPAENPAAETAAEATPETAAENPAAETAETAAIPDNGADDNDPLAKYDADTLREMYLRAIAEKENIAKRTLSEIRKAHDFALSRFAPGICEVCDCLEMALAGFETAPEETKAREGVSLTLRKLFALMEANGILPVRPDPGAMFDTNLHQAAGFAPGEENARTVSIVMQSGYTLNGRLVRPAIVQLGKPPTDANAADAAGNNS